MTSSEQAIRCIHALEYLHKLMDLYDDCNDEQQKKKKKKVFITSNQIEKILLKDIAWKNNEDEDTFCPMNMENFEEILTMLEPEIKKNNELLINNGSARIHVAITLRYLIAGESYRTLEKLSLISRKTICKMVPQVLKALIKVLENENLMVLMAESDWHDIANDFKEFWQFPHTLGIIDGKHICTKTSIRNTSGSNFSSLIILGVIDAHSRFIHIDIINSEQCKPSHAYRNSNFYHALTSKTFPIPANEPLEGQTVDTRYSFIGDDFLEMDRYIIKSYEQNVQLSSSKKEFNRRLSRARMPVNMAFEILFYRFKIFYRTCDIDVNICDLVIRACCLLHNYFTQNLIEIPNIDVDPVVINLPKTILPLPTQKCEKYKGATEMRDNVRSYCVNGENIQEQWNKTFKSAVIEFE